MPISGVLSGPGMNCPVPLVSQHCFYQHISMPSSFFSGRNGEGMEEFTYDIGIEYFRSICEGRKDTGEVCSKDCGFCSLKRGGRDEIAELVFCLVDSGGRHDCSSDVVTGVGERWVVMGQGR